MNEHQRKEAALLGLCVHNNCPRNRPHWHGGIYRLGHIRTRVTTARHHAEETP